MAEEGRPSGGRRTWMRLGLPLVLVSLAGVTLFAPVWRCVPCDGRGLTPSSGRGGRSCVVCGGRGRIELSRFLDLKGGSLWEREPVR